MANDEDIRGMDYFYCLIRSIKIEKKEQVKRDFAIGSIPSSQILIPNIILRG